MHEFSTNATFWVAVLLFVFGCLSTMMARLSTTSRQPFFQAMFFVAMLAVGTATITFVVLGHGLWLSGGVTLALMAVGATLDLQNPRPVQSI